MASYTSKWNSRECPFTWLGRGNTFMRPVASELAESFRLTGLCDTSMSSKCMRRTVYLPGIARLASILCVAHRFTSAISKRFSCSTKIPQEAPMHIACL